MTTQTMKAVVLTGHGGMDKLEYHTDWTKPVAAANEVLIKVGACGLNNTDVNTRTAWYSATVAGPTKDEAQPMADMKDASWSFGAIPFPRIQGADVCGVVEAVGDNVDSAFIGRRILVDTWLRDWDEPLNKDKAGYYGSEANGGFAEYAIADFRNTHPVESDLSDAELATFATAYVTAENMLNRAGVNENDTVLITGASGGVGSALVQLVSRRGGRAIALCGEEKMAAVKEIGAHAVISRNSPDLAAAVLEACGQKNVSVVADVVGGDRWQEWINVLCRGGRYTCSGAIAGAQVDFDLRPFYLRDLTFTGATVVPPGVFKDLVGYIERGEIRPLLAATYPLEQFHDAQKVFMQKKHIGNIVVCP